MITIYNDGYDDLYDEYTEEEQDEIYFQTMIDERNNFNWLYDDDEDDEEWKDIEGFEGLYQVSNKGRVKALERMVENNGGMQHKHEKILKPHFKDTGHSYIVLCKNGETYPQLVHRVVAKTFIPNPENKPEVDHLDTNPYNNNVENLAWVTHKENSNNELTRYHISKSKMGHKGWGRSWTEEEKQKQSEKLKGRIFSDEHKQRLSEAQKNKNIRN